MKYEKAEIIRPKTNVKAIAVIAILVVADLLFL